jgi:drug/metabolite transporter (DMT)-like permease
MNRIAAADVNTGAVIGALGAAALFGASTPVAKALVADVHPVVLAALLYLGSGIGLLAFRARVWLRPGGTGLARGDWPWLAGAIAFGGVLGPVMLMLGLVRTSGASASLLLNLEAVLTALIAWVVFRENADRRIVLGMALIVAGGVALAWPTDASGAHDAIGAALVAAACLCWAIDNNLTRKVSAGDATFIAGAKGLVAGAVNLAIGLAIGGHLPAPAPAVAALAVGLLGYGVSLVLFVVALRGLGTARTGAYFSTAPFIGAAVAIGVFVEPTSPAFWLAAALMGAGVWLHLTERHEHPHTHEPLEHTHPHAHDEHHRHDHDFAWDGAEPHAHAHRHAALTHAHPHYPDLHHRHSHGGAERVTARH